MQKPVPAQPASALIDQRIKGIGGRDGDVGRAIDLHEGEEIDATAVKVLIRAAVAGAEPRRQGKAGRLPR